MTTYPIMIGWERVRITDRELTVFKNAALEVLRQNLSSESGLKFDFEESTGTIKCLGAGTVGTFAGLKFHADLPAGNGEKRFADFLVTHHVIDQGLPHRDRSYLRMSRDGGEEVKEIYLKGRPKIIRRRSMN